MLMAGPASTIEVIQNGTTKNGNSERDNVHMP
jgi:hypothetical protein